ncbi:hypothetical protein SKZB199_0950 [Streptococcus sp. ZB199]|nr:hypothetical protein SKZB199_0950 [Streptococcus sp. ZB199]
MSGAFSDSLENIVCDRNFLFEEVVLFGKFDDTIIMVIEQLRVGLTETASDATIWN